MFNPTATLAINLDRRPDRWQKLLETLPAAIGAPQRFSGTDGWTAALPAGRRDRGAYGCWDSHYRALKDADDASVDSVLIFEDDALPSKYFDSDYPEFCDALPDDWQFAYLGGAIMDGRPPRKVNRFIYAPGKVHTSHAYAVRQPFLGKLVKLIEANTRFQHIDHFVGDYFSNGTRPGCYCAARWLFDQDGGQSDISGRNHAKRLTWENPQDVRPSRLRPRQQTCQLGPSGKCLRVGCKGTGLSVCKVGRGLHAHKIKGGLKYTVHSGISHSQHA